MGCPGVLVHLTYWLNGEDQWQDAKWPERRRRVQEGGASTPSPQDGAAQHGGNSALLTAQTELL